MCQALFLYIQWNSSGFNATKNQTTIEDLFFFIHLTSFKKRQERIKRVSGPSKKIISKLNVERWLNSGKEKLLHWLWINNNKKVTHMKSSIALQVLNRHFFALLFIWKFTTINMSNEKLSYRFYWVEDITYKDMKYSEIIRKISLKNIPISMEAIKFQIVFQIFYVISSTPIRTAIILKMHE